MLTEVVKTGEGQQPNIEENCENSEGESDEGSNVKFQDGRSSTDVGEFGEKDEKGTMDEYILKETTDCYNSLDLMGNKYLSPNEVTSAFASFHIDIDADDSKEIVRAFDSTGHGHIEFQDFHREMHETMLNGTTEEHLRMVFDMMDEDRNGFIGANEITRQFQKLGALIEPNDALEAVKIIAMDGYGQIDFTQFKNFCDKMEKATCSKASNNNNTSKKGIPTYKNNERIAEKIQPKGRNVPAHA